MGCHGAKMDYADLEINFNQEPKKDEDGTYEIPASAITKIGHRTIDGWKKIVGMHFCTALGAAAVCGIIVGSVVTCIIKK